MDKMSVIGLILIIIGFTCLLKWLDRRESRKLSRRGSSPVFTEMEKLEPRNTPSVTMVSMPGGDQLQVYGQNAAIVITPDYAGDQSRTLVTITEKAGRSTTTTNLTIDHLTEVIMTGLPNKKNRLSLVSDVRLYSEIYGGNKADTISVMTYNNSWNKIEPGAGNDTVNSFGDGYSWIIDDDGNDNVTLQYGSARLGKGNNTYQAFGTYGYQYFQVQGKNDKIVGTWQTNVGVIGTGKVTITGNVASIGFGFSIYDQRKPNSLVLKLVNPNYTPPTYVFNDLGGGPKG